MSDVVEATLTAILVLSGRFFLFLLLLGDETTGDSCRIDDVDMILTLPVSESGSRSRNEDVKIDDDLKEEIKTQHETNNLITRILLKLLIITINYHFFFVEGDIRPPKKGNDLFVVETILLLLLFEAVTSQN